MSNINGRPARHARIIEWLVGHTPAVVASAYAVISTLWIIFSDAFAASIASTPRELHDIQTYKGEAFVILSAALIYLMLRRAWRHLYRSHEETRRSEERLDLALSSAGGGVWELAFGTDERSSAFLSPELATRLGFPPDMPLTMGDIAERRHPDDVPHCDRAFAELMAGKTGALDIRYRVLAADGQYRWVQTRGKVALDAKGTPDKLIGVSFEIDEQVRTQARVRELLRFDPVTGLAKPRKFLDEIDADLARQPSGTMALVQFRLLGLDQLLGEGETAEDSCVAGAVGDRLQKLADSQVHASRIASDIFAVATPPLSGAHALQELVGAVVDALSLPFLVGGATHRLRWAAGGALYPSDGANAGVLLRNSSHALDKAERGEAGVHWFTEGLDIEFRKRNERLAQLAHAVRNGEIECHFQPLVCLAEGRTAGFEALARWQRPDEGLVPPDEFIPLAEEYGHIVGIGEEVLRQACAAAALWPASSGAGAPFVAVNVSSVQIEDPAFPALVARILGEAGLSPSRLELEVTETALARDPTAAARRLAELRSLGISIAIDDFGTGYSSLKLLSLLPFNRLKIDRSFISGYGNAHDATTIVDTIIDLCRQLQLEITAEGVELPATAARLRQRGVEIAQGYCFSRPVPASQARQMVSRAWDVSGHDRADDGDAWRSLARGGFSAR